MVNVVIIMPYKDQPLWGVENVAYNLVQGFIKISDRIARDGVTITIISNTGRCINRIEHKELTPEISVIFYKMIPPVTFTGDVQNSILSSFLIRRHLSSADIVHSHDMLFSFQFSMLFSKKQLLHHFHTLAKDVKTLLGSKYHEIAYTTLGYRISMLTRRPNVKFATISQFEKKELFSMFNIPKEVYLIYNPISEDFFQITRSENEGLILSPGRLIPRKNHLILLKALGLLKSSGISDFKLVLTGSVESPAYFSELKKVIKKYNLSTNVLFTGPLSRKKLLEYYSKASLVVIPSLRENFALPIIEAMASKVPVISSPVGIAPEAIENGRTGLLIEPNNPIDIANKIELLLSEKKLRWKIGKNAFKKAQRWRPQTIATVTLDVWREIYGTF